VLIYRPIFIFLRHPERSEGSPDFLGHVKTSAMKMA
jgi:hypothetical protein